MKQAVPQTLNDAVCMTLQRESNLALSRVVEQASTAVQSAQSGETSIQAVSWKNQADKTDKLEQLLTSITTRLENLEQFNGRLYPQEIRPQRNPHFRPAQPIICNNYQKEGHFAQGCAVVAVPRIREMNNPRGDWSSH